MTTRNANPAGPAVRDVESRSDELLVSAVEWAENQAILPAVHGPGPTGLVNGAPE